ncbi:uncharacterized protein DSM5745_07137 [Aspergillus mulundensis]|uniref:ATP-grasp domain-containing protein n=1 Tax=Aspergillus mulundensis TaxID=1810919 RepID=A0A3D8RK99_9EURO|nr:Uncharacterized protein DSM5745_07137 [Aspergillus mulundensis]RDW74475.1 Uncharacterized protein DSM5745_07137 [Aspergillus mulundensis]
MTVLGIRRMNSISSREIHQRVRRLIQSQILGHLLRIAISLLLLPLDNTVIFVAEVAWFLSPYSLWLSTINGRHAILRDVQFRPKTILVTGVDSPHGLRIARCWYNEGHRVVGAAIKEARFASGESMSKALVAYYRIPNSQYVSRLLDIVLREKVDIWIPCSQDTSAIDDGMAKQAIESRTSCKCVTLDTELASQWNQTESFVQYLIDHGHPVVENHQVQSRDSIHRILHRSPTKIYHIRQTVPGNNGEKIIVLPKRTLSSTYSEVSEIKVSKDSPWAMEQHARLGEFVAEVLIIRGHVTAIRVHPAGRESDCGCSRLNEGLSAAARQVMEDLACKGGHRLTGHFLVRLMVDEELHLNSVRYEVRIAGCAQGAAAIARLLQDTPSRTLVDGYLTILPENAPGALVNGLNRPEISISMLSHRPSFYEAFKSYATRDINPALCPLAQQVNWAMDEAAKLVLFWTNWRFSITDPLPWWWHNHVSWPLTELDLLLQSIKRALAS